MVAVAFVLLEEARSPDPAEVVRRASQFGYSLVYDEGSASPSTFTIASGGNVMVMLIEAPHPDAAKMAPGLASPSEEDLARMRAHYIVAMMGGPETPREQDTMLAQITAAIVRASPAIGAMLGTGRCFHRADFFAEVVERTPAELPMLVCIDFTRAPEPGDRMSILSHGMVRYGREEFFVTCSIRGKGAFDFVMSMVGWMLDDATKELPTGDTVGRNANERIVVQRVPSPLGEGPPVIKLDLDL
ncbi:MAG TPA: hypothetical protein VG755_12150 [Nannocystaceae bacterium]|nr:hypothetical protein [Nannocystaceae bacterium]